MRMINAFIMSAQLVGTTEDRQKGEELKAEIDRIFSCMGAKGMGEKGVKSKGKSFFTTLQPQGL